MTSFSLSVGWGARQESVEQCRDRLDRFLSELSGFDPAFATWYVQGRSRRGPFRNRVEIGNREYLLKLMDQRRYWNDDKQLMEDLGFLLVLRNGDDKVKEAVDMTVKCGGYTEEGRNGVVITFLENFLGFANWEVMARLLALAARVWQAETGRVRLIVVNEPIPNTEVTCREFHWMIYYSQAERDHFPPLPSHARVVPVDPIGTIVVTQDEPPDVANPEHLQRIEQVETALKIVSF